jgi:hypothetical protein
MMFIASLRPQMTCVRVVTLSLSKECGKGGTGKRLASPSSASLRFLHAPARTSRAYSE